ncbi:hypothetical protein LCGC14_3096590, partial [marine sediment metagenome]
MTLALCFRPFGMNTVEGEETLYFSSPSTISYVNFP